MPREPLTSTRSPLRNQGTITLNGESLKLIPDRDGSLKAADAKQLQHMRAKLAMVFQHFNLWAHMTAIENVAEAPIHVLGLSKDAAMARAEQLLQRVGVAHRKNMYPAHLSGGEQQRVAIARAIAKRPAVLLCDEPTGALDISTGMLVLEALDRVNRELGTATAVITHNAAIAAMADRVVRLADGRVVDVRSNLRRVAPKELQW